MRSRDVGHGGPALEPERWRRHLWTGFLVVPRWATIIWMIVLAATGFPQDGSSQETSVQS